MIKDNITWQIFKGLQKCQDKGIIVYQAMAHRFQTAQKQDVFLYPDVICHGFLDETYNNSF